MLTVLLVAITCWLVFGKKAWPRFSLYVLCGVTLVAAATLPRIGSGLLALVAVGYVACLAFLVHRRRVARRAARPSVPELRERIRLPPGRREMRP